jgi:hypothetical protein
MATQYYIDECKNGANSNRLCRFNISGLDINQSNYLQSLEINSKVSNDGVLIGTMVADKGEIKFVNLPNMTYSLTTDTEYLADKTYYIVFEDEYIPIDDADDEIKQSYNYGVGNEIEGDVYEGTHFEITDQTFYPQIGVRYLDESEEYITFDSLTAETIKDNQTGNTTALTAYGGGTRLDKMYLCNLNFTATYHQAGDEHYVSGTEYWELDEKTKDLPDSEKKYILLDEGVDYRIGDLIDKTLYLKYQPTHTIWEFYLDACNQLSLTPLDESFANSDIALPGNPFTNNETLRVVIQEVEKVSCSIARINWFASTINLGWFSASPDYVFTPDDYSSLSGSFTKYGPINTVILGNSQVDGENVTLEDPESVQLYGEHQYVIDASYFLYTQELRGQAIQNVFSRLNGFVYYDLELTTYYGKPFIKTGDMIQVITTEGDTYNTYVLDHTFTYDGSFKSVIKSPALNTEEQKIKNQQNSSSVTGRLRKTELTVDKINGEIDSTVEELTSTGSRLSKLKQTVDDITAIFKSTGGTNIIRNSQFLFKDETWKFETNSASNDYHTELGNSYDGSLSGITVAPAKIKLKNFKLTSALAGDTSTSIDNIVGLIPDRQYTLNFYYKADSTTTNTVRLYGAHNTDIADIQLTTLEPTESMTKQSFTFVARTSDYRLEFNTTTNETGDTGYFYIYDLMLNLGDEKTWETNPSEAYSTAVQMSLIGLTVTSTGADVRTYMTTDGFYVKRISDNVTVNDLNKEGIKTEKANMKELNIRYDNTIEFVMKEIQINGTAHHIEYYDTEE